MENKLKPRSIPYLKVFLLFYMTRPIDWDLEEKYLKLNSKIGEIDDRLKIIGSDIKEIKEDIKAIANLLKENLSIEPQKIDSILGKKRYRSKAPSKKGKKDEEIK